MSAQFGIVRDLARDDYVPWRRLWDGYCRFYEAVVPSEVTAATWAAALDPTRPVLGRAAFDHNERMIGFSMSITHPSTWQIEPSCYLEDLFVDPGCRGNGVGRALIDDLVALCLVNGWGRLFWHTRADNTAARRLYDHYVAADNFVRYRLEIRNRRDSRA
jgi:GNAT superfamily N-acetyltransferase